MEIPEVKSAHAAFVAAQLRKDRDAKKLFLKFQQTHKAVKEVKDEVNEIVRNMRLNDF